jgi:hypothetical protein
MSESHKFINNPPVPEEATVPGDKSGLVPSALSTSVASSGSDAFVPPALRGAGSGPSGPANASDPEAMDLTRWTNIRPRANSDET